MLRDESIGAHNGGSIKDRKYSNVSMAISKQSMGVHTRTVFRFMTQWILVSGV